MAEPTAKERAWTIFDRIVADAAPNGDHTNPWFLDSQQRLRYQPDVDILTKLLGVPLYLSADSRTGVPALALDVWLSYELRRAGFAPDATWPRATNPRILPTPIVNLLTALPDKERDALAERLSKRTAIPGVTSSSASILGKNYMKQVDVIMTDWATGPELLISTKRMDSSFGKNAANRVEESYGDAKNLRLRHPLAALGFVFALRSTVLDREPDKAEWLIDLLGKLGREDDAYHATCLLMIEYEDGSDTADAGLAPEDGLVVDELAPDPQLHITVSETDRPEFEHVLSRLPAVHLREDATPWVLAPSRFLAAMVNRVLDATPVTRHVEARARRREVAGGHLGLHPMAQ